MRFKVGDFQPGAPGQRGVIKASRAAGGKSDATQSVTGTSTVAMPHLGARHRRSGEAGQSMVTVTLWTRRSCRRRRGWP